MERESRMKRIAIGQLQQETNTFNPRQTPRRDFEDYGWAEGEAVVARHGGTDELAGFTALPELFGEPIEWVGLTRVKELAGGPVADAVVDEVVAGLRATLGVQAVDGVLYSLHGALASPTRPDVDGYLLSVVRELVGPDVPIVATLDLHANITRAMLAAADLLVGYHTFPHIDHESCGRRAAKAMADFLRHGTGHQVSAVKLPMVVNAKGFTTNGPLMAGIYQRLAAAEANGALATGVFMAQPWLDVPELGWTLYQAWRGEKPPLDFEALAHECWNARVHNARSLPGPDEIADEALRLSGHPVVVSEGHDATNSGAPGDSTRLIAALLAREWPEAGALSYCIDPAAVNRCHEAGVGAEFNLRFGGEADPFSEALERMVKVESVREVTFVHNGHAGHNLTVNMGRSATVRCGSVTILLAERKGLGSTPRLYETAGLDPRRFKFVSAKSPEGFRHDYATIGAHFLYCGAPGCAWEQIGRLPFEHANRPLFPLDDPASPAAASWAWKLHLTK